MWVAGATHNPVEMPLSSGWSNTTVVVDAVAMAVESARRTDVWLAIRQPFRVRMFSRLLAVTLNIVEWRRDARSDKSEVTVCGDAIPPPAGNLAIFELPWEPRPKALRPRLSAGLPLLRGHSIRRLRDAANCRLPPT